jgi:APA family basic amino acid/polyamine antiporter
VASSSRPIAPEAPSASSEPDLTRRLGVFPATNIVVANMIGAGIFTTSGLLMDQLGDARLLLVLWLAGGALALLGALCYGELGAALPRAGGEYAYLAELFHPLLGFLTGWVSFFVGFSAPLAASALGVSEYLGRAWPQLLAAGDPGLVKKAVAILVIGALAAVHLRGVEFGARVQNVLTVGKIALIAGLIAAGFALGRGDLAHLGSAAAASAVPGAGPATAGAGAAAPSGFAGWQAVGLSLMWIMFAYSGWNAAAYVGSELRDPERSLPRSLLVGTGIVTLLYVGLNLLYVYALPPAEMRGVIAIGGAAASRLFGSVAETIVSALIAFALVSSVSALILLGPRVYYAMARDGYLFKAVARVNPLTRAPSAAIAVQCLIAAVMVLTGTFDQILTYMGFCLGIFPIVAVAGVVKLRRAGTLPFRMPGYPLPPVLYAAASVAMLVLAYVERPVESSIAVVTVLAGIPFYLMAARARGARGGGK